MFCSSVPAILTAVAISAGPPAFPAMFDDAPPPRPPGALLPFDDDASTMDEVSSDDDISPAAEGISAASANARGDTGGGARESAGARAGEPPSSPGDAVPPLFPGADRALEARRTAGWARLLPRLILSVSAAYRNQARAAGRSAEMTIWLWLSWSLDARAMQGSMR